MVIPLEKVPPQLINAFVAAEDQNFWTHGGIDFERILGAAIADIKAGGFVQGASTLTMQVVKRLYLSPAKKFERKIREAIIARRLEANLTKHEILFIYMNEVYLGHGAYGVEAAAMSYFDKSVKDLTLTEMATLAGLPKAPSRYSPHVDPKASENQRKYVLGRMLEEGYIKKDEYEEALEEELAVKPAQTVFDLYYPLRDKVPHFAEHVRRYIADNYGLDTLYKGGLKVYTTVNVPWSLHAEEALDWGLRKLHKRQGYGGPKKVLEEKEWDEFLEKAAEVYGDELDPTRYYFGLVTEVTDRGASVKIGNVDGYLPLGWANWAKEYDKERLVNSVHIRTLKEALKPGYVIEVRHRPLEKTDYARYGKEAKRAKGAELAALSAWGEGREEPLRVSLEENPRVEGALLSYEHKSGYVKVMLGGHDYDDSEFNRAFQSCRQPGSVFKPFVYSKALDLGYTLATALPDVPISEFDWKREKRWKPGNYGGGYKGEVLLRNALVNSMNLPSLHLVGMVEPDIAADWAAHLGITTDLKYPVVNKDGTTTYHSDPTLVLGAYCVKPWDVIQAYGVFARMGTRPKPITIRKIEDRHGVVIEDNSTLYDPFIDGDDRIDRLHASLFIEEERVIDEKVAWLTQYLLRNVVLGGTGAAARRLPFPVAGKTGTTNDAFDAWFMGFTEEILTGVWVGFDNNERPLGIGETGGRAALPIWMRFMDKALAGVKQAEIPGEKPKGIVGATVDAKTGLLADTGKRVSFPFIHGTVPTERAVRADKPTADMADRVDEDF